MQKLIGSILVLPAPAGAGYLYGEGLKDYLRQMEYLRYIAGMIRGQLEYTGAPLQELLMDVSAKIKEPYKSWLEHTARRTAKRTDADFTEIWKGCVEKDLGAAGLKKEHREWIRDFGAFLGQGDRETMGRSIELSMKQMDLMIRQQRGELAGKRKIGNWLGVMSGLFLIILLWYNRGGDMNINLIFKIAAVGILVSILSQVLKHSGRDEQAFLTSLAGLILVLSWVLPYIYDLFQSIRQLFML